MTARLDLSGDAGIPLAGGSLIGFLLAAPCRSQPHRRAVRRRSPALTSPTTRAPWMSGGAPTSHSGAVSRRPG